MYSLRPRGTVSVSMSVTKPCWYSRLASSWMVLVAVVIVSFHSSLGLPRMNPTPSRMRHPRRGRHGEQGAEHLDGAGGQVGPQALGDLALAADQVGERHLVEDAPHPLLQRLPQGPQGAAVVVDAGARLGPGVPLAVGRVL